MPSFVPGAMRLAAALSVATTPAIAESDFSRVLAVETFSLESNGDTDRAVLVDNGDSGADLYIYRALDPAAAADRPAKPALVKKSAAWNGGLWGSRPSLGTNGKGALLVKSQNTGAGRNKWTQTLTIVYRNGAFLVAGLTREAYDSLDPGRAHACDMNFLSGKGRTDGKPFEVKLKARPLVDWSDGDLPKECAF